MNIKIIDYTDKYHTAVLHYSLFDNVTVEKVSDLPREEYDATDPDNKYWTVTTSDGKVYEYRNCDTDIQVCNPDGTKSLLLWNGGSVPVKEVKEIKTKLPKPIYFKKVKSGVLDGIGRAETVEYAEKLRRLGYIETTQERYRDVMSKNLYISYMVE